MATNIQNCPECGRSLHILEPRPGKRVICPKCSMRFYPAGQCWLESPASIPLHLPRMGKPFWALATLLLLAGVAGSLLLFSHSSGVTPSPPAQAASKANASTRKPDSRSEFDRLMVAGNAALARHDFREAIASYKEAQILLPEDVDAARALAAARASLADQENIPPPDPVLTEVATNVQVAQKAIVDQQGNRSDFMRLMNQASVAMLDGRYDDARTFYVQALQLATDPAASPVLALSTGNPFAPPVIQTPPSDSAGASQAALDGLRQANYQKAMADGDAAMRTRNYSDAILDFQAALRQKPCDRDASSGLIQARAYAG
jgi:tetratricopeptide (TPR) repeat protein